MEENLEYLCNYMRKGLKCQNTCHKIKKKDEIDSIKLRCMLATWMDLGSGKKVWNRWYVTFVKLKTYSHKPAIYILQEHISNERVDFKKVAYREEREMRVGYRNKGKGNTHHNKEMQAEGPCTVLWWSYVIYVYVYIWTHIYFCICLHKHRPP